MAFGCFVERMSARVQLCACWSPAPALPQALLLRALTRRYARPILEVDTPHGLARAHLRSVGSPAAALVLGHGAGGGIESPDLVGATEAARSAQLAVALIEQPYRVAGRRTPASASQLDTAWASVVSQLCDGPFSGLSILTGGRSLGARVACRTAAETDSLAVLCLAFPLHPPGRPEKSRLSELDDVKVPILVIQGKSDPFGMPPEGPNRTVARVPGTHSLRSSTTVAAAVWDWLVTLAPILSEGSATKAR